MERVEFELAYYDSAVRSFNHHTTSKCAEWQVKPDFFSISIFSSSIWVIIIGVT